MKATIPTTPFGRALGGSAAVLIASAGCFNDEPTDCDAAWELALEAREAAERAMTVIEYEAEQLEDWVSADSTAEAWVAAAWNLVPRADSAAESAWNEALAALETVDSTAHASLAAAEAVASRYPSGFSQSTLEAVQEATRAAAAAFEAVAVGCPLGTPSAAVSPREIRSDSVLDGCEVWAWAVAVEAEGMVAYEALQRARGLSVLVDSVLLEIDTEDPVLLRAWDAGVDLPGSTFRAAIEAGVVTRRAGNLVSELARYGCPAG